jgi:hypothetical protein
MPTHDAIITRTLVQIRVSVFTVTRLWHGLVFQSSPPATRRTKVNHSTSKRISAEPASSTRREFLFLLASFFVSLALRSVQKRVYRNHCCHNSVSSVKIQLTRRYIIPCLRPVYWQIRHSSRVAAALLLTRAAPRSTPRGALKNPFLQTSTWACWRGRGPH